MKIALTEEEIKQAIIDYRMYLDGISGNIEEVMGETYLEFFGI